MALSSESDGTDAYIGLGANTGERHVQIEKALIQLDAEPAISVQRVSSAYETEAHCLPDQDAMPPFLNGVAHLHTTLSPDNLLTRTQALEARAGRVASAQWAPRPLDIDLLMVGPVEQATDRLVLPHPRLHERRFVLVPWAELAPNLWVPHPFDATVQNLLNACADKHAIRPVAQSLARSLSLSDTSS